MEDPIVPFVEEFTISISTAASSKFRQGIEAALLGGFHRAVKHFALHENRSLCKSALSKVPPPSGTRWQTS
jgi:hypothetical protein